MTQQEVLTKAIEKAFKGGWKDGTIEAYVKVISVANSVVIRGIIFNHDFARALWGEKKVKHNAHALIKDGKKVGESYGMMFAWEIHLQQMVIADDPIKYLKEHM
jgi:hypothetical protein